MTPSRSRLLRSSGCPGESLVDGRLHALPHRVGYMGKAQVAGDGVDHFLSLVPASGSCITEQRVARRSSKVAWPIVAVPSPDQIAVALDDLTPDGSPAHGPGRASSDLGAEPLVAQGPAILP